MRVFKVEGVDTDDGSRTELASFDNSGEARAFLYRYVRREDAGGWNLIEVYDMFERGPCRHRRARAL